jgi:hypothetical protein
MCQGVRLTDVVASSWTARSGTMICNMPGNWDYKYNEEDSIKNLVWNGDGVCGDREGGCLAVSERSGGYLKATADLLYPAVTAPDMLMAASWPSLNEFLRALLTSKTPSKYMRTGTCQNSHASRLLESFNHDWVWI